MMTNLCKIWVTFNLLDKVKPKLTSATALRILFQLAQTGVEDTRKYYSSAMIEKKSNFVDEISLNS